MPITVSYELPEEQEGRADEQRSEVSNVHHLCSLVRGQVLGERHEDGGGQRRGVNRDEQGHESQSEGPEPLPEACEPRGPDS
jgi:hypothetical protein